MLLDGESWRRHFDGFRRDAFRLEAQPAYTMPREAENLARFLRGEPKPEGHNAAWHQRVRGFVSSGRTIGRVRVVRRPLTDYQRYQFAWGIPGNIAAGEDIRILDATEEDHGIPDQDWWMFDEVSVVHLNFRPDGTQVNRELVDERAVECQELKRSAIEHSVPFFDYLKEHG
ncbi:DUF6879 family protein [Streptomyces sp. CB01881]|uniref:DUF6879 family protein n=1 Tax=Streptomyces sp. CB01881 TaxID=2078691 RepID=UPI000CDBF60D|nr:DUF6879 family protein [Streptomyces sp. CB01881]AUY49436.1 hypothetical protein C2142_11345 [Streptomyces sp. CB01881]TYC72820.1 hypothetical protein EH183_11345 [Streptomyces sp. CB01881]